MYSTRSTSCVYSLDVCDFFFNDTATTEIYTYRHTLSLHDALPISRPATAPRAARIGCRRRSRSRGSFRACEAGSRSASAPSCSRPPACRSEEHTSELQSLMRISYAVFCLKKKNNQLKKQPQHI